MAIHTQVTVNGPSAYGSYVGESEANLRRIFGQAAARAEHGPVVLFIDEIVCRATLHQTHPLLPNTYHFVSYQPLGAKSLVNVIRIASRCCFTSQELIPDACYGPPCIDKTTACHTRYPLCMKTPMTVE
jgi:hypothetical protein